MFKAFKPFYLLSLFIVFSVSTVSAQATDYQRGVELFNDYQEEKKDLIVEFSYGYRLPSAPKSLLHGEATEYSVLMIHGLNGSPYRMKDLGEVFYNQGMNVIHILLPGHGTHHTRMYDVSYREWIAETQRGLKIASLLGEKVLIAGFSTGAGLAIQETLTKQQPIAGLFLFAPALQIRFDFINKLVPLACHKKIKSWRVPVRLKPLPIKYNVYAANGVCQVAQLIKNNLTTSEPSAMLTPLIQPLSERKEPIINMAQQISTPTFMVFTQKDRLLSPQAMIHFFENLNTKKKHSIAYTNDTSFNKIKISQPDFFDIYQDAPLKHADLILRDNPYTENKSHVNPYFDDLEKSIIKFIEQNF